MTSIVSDRPLNLARTSILLNVVVGYVAFYTPIFPVSSPEMVPALPSIANHFGISSPTLLDMTLSMFLLAYARVR